MSAGGPHGTPDPQATPWSNHDSALWWACQVAHDLGRGRSTEHFPAVASPFAPEPPDTTYLATGPYELLDYRAVGDGSWTRNGGFFFATGGLGLALTAASAVARSTGNARRRRRAIEDATPRWLPVDGGHLYVGSHGFALHSVLGLIRPPYAQVSAAEMTAPRHIMITVVVNGQQAVQIVVSDWAELLFVCWAERRHPRHPQLVQHGWLPPGWFDRARAFGHPTPLDDRGQRALPPAAHEP